MEVNWSELILFPTIVLFIEYFVVQPIKRFQETLPPIQALESSQDKNKYKWSDGIKNAISQFKKTYKEYRWGWFSFKQNFINISKMSISKGQAELTLEVTERYFLDLFGKSKPIARYVVIIDRVGDISNIEMLQKKREQNGEMPLPVSWIVIIGIAFFIFILSDAQQPAEGMVTVKETPIANFWVNAIPLAISSSTNGTLGIGEVDSYSFTSTTNDILTVTVNTIDNFSCYLFIYNQNNSLIRSETVSGNLYNSIDFAPEVGKSYLFVISATAGNGGSYVFNIRVASAD